MFHTIVLRATETCIVSPNGPLDDLAIPFDSGSPEGRSWNLHIMTIDGGRPQWVESEPSQYRGPNVRKGWLKDVGLLYFAVADPSGECIVVSARSRLLFKRVCFRAERDCQFGRDMIASGNHSMRVWKRNYRLSAGRTVCLSYPFWKRLRVGDKVQFRALAMHPFARSAGLA